MDKRFRTEITIDIHDWEVVVMAEAGYDYQNGRFFDWERFNEEHGFTYEKMGTNHWDAVDQIQAVLGWYEGADNGSYTYMSKEDFDIEYAEEYAKDEGYSPEVIKLRREILEAVRRCFEKGIAPEEFMLEINW
jgi:hypothetical protein